MNAENVKHFQPVAVSSHSRRLGGRAGVTQKRQQ